MRQGPRYGVPPSRHQHSSRPSYAKLIVIGGFSIGLLAGYFFLGTPAKDHANAAKQTLVSYPSTAGVGLQRDAIHENRENQGMGHVPSAPEVKSIDRPPPYVGVTEHDQRHPQNVKAMMAQQSSHDEHQSTVVNQMKQQQSDTSEKDRAAGAKKTVVQPKQTARKAGFQKQQQTTSSSADSTSTDAALQKAKDQLNQGNTQGQGLRGGKAVSTVGAAKANPNQPGDTIHTLFTSNGSPYQNFQARIMIGTYNLVRQMPGGEKLVALTRILHRTTPDEIMDEVDTFRANPVQPECDKWCWFPVADRANAVKQWIYAAEKNTSLVKAPWLLLLETDYVFVKPLRAPGNAYDPKVPGLSFAFDYIGARGWAVEKMLKEKCPTCDANTVPNSGPAPVLLRFNDLKAAAPMWEELSTYIETHEDIKKALGWVREMYAWDIAVAANRLNIRNEGHPITPLIAQPPHDISIYNATMYHYTWGSIFKKDGKEIWKFDKRFYTDPKDALKVPMLPLPPPWEPDVVLQDGLAVSKELHATLTNMVETMNKGIATLRDLTTKT